MTDITSVVPGVNEKSGVNTSDAFKYHIITDQYSLFILTENVDPRWLKCETSWSLWSSYTVIASGAGWSRFARSSVNTGRASRSLFASAPSFPGDQVLQAHHHFQGARFSRCPSFQGDQVLQEHHHFQAGPGLQVPIISSQERLRHHSRGGHHGSPGGPAQVSIISRGTMISRQHHHFQGDQVLQAHHHFQGDPVLQGHHHFQGDRSQVQPSFQGPGAPYFQEGLVSRCTIISRRTRWPRCTIISRGARFSRCAIISSEVPGSFPAGS